ncbi:MAG: PilZ domain-containing protein, partial [Myxococcaceae bacterium]
EPLSRKTKERRDQDDRRESPRVPMQFLLRDVAEGGSYVEREGDLAIGGIFWKGKYAALGTEVEVRFRLTGIPKEIRAMGEIIRVENADKGLNFHVRFTELDVMSELAIAKFIDEHGM